MTIAIRFDGPPGRKSGRFIEVEQDGESIRLGEWKKDGRDWLLMLPETPRLYGLVSYCAEHDTHPAKGEPCWSCVNHHIANAIIVTLEQARLDHSAQERVGELEDEIQAAMKQYEEWEKEIEASDAILNKLEANIKGLEEVLYEVSRGGGIPPRYGVTYIHQAGRCKVHRRKRGHLQAMGEIIAEANKEFVFTKEEILEAVKKLWMKP